MRLFAPLYLRVLQWARAPYAVPVLAGLSLVEAFVFPVLPELMLLPMALARPERSFRYANLSLVCSLLGSLIGYALGHYLFDALRPALASLGWLPTLEGWIERLRVDARYHPWAVFGTLVLAGFSPVPMKVFSWAAGAVGLPLPVFLSSMAVGRGKRVWLLALLVRWAGPRAEPLLQRYAERLGWLALGLLAVLALVLWQHRHGALS